MSILKTRRSIRKYLAQDVSNETIEKIISETILAPSGHNTQPWKFIIVRDEEIKRKIVAADNNQTWMLEAPVFIVCLADASVRFADISQIDFRADSPDFVFKQLIRDCSIGITYLLLASEQNGLGACWTGWYNHDEMKKILNIPNYMYVNGIVTLGYADEKPDSRPRLKLEEVLIANQIK